MESSLTRKQLESDPSYISILKVRNLSLDAEAAQLGAKLKYHHVDYRGQRQPVKPK